ncbi:D-ribose pyranase [Ignatzschineria sp. LJL83]
MFKSKMLNSEVNSVLARLGHTDQLVVADAGLPIPNSVTRIDLALIPGVPSFIETLQAIMEVMQIEKVILADEIETQNPELHTATLKLIESYSQKNREALNKPAIIIEYVSHEEFKAKTQLEPCKAIVRTGECTPYANIILESGVVF